MAHWHYDGEEWCDGCLPVPEDHEDVGYDDGEQDTPAHCAGCGCPLDYTLTPDGVEYVLDAIRHSLRESPASRNRIIPMPGTAEETLTYYHGSRHVEIVRDWASNISNYFLSDREGRLVESFLARTSK